jgi:hypothetical protein
VFTVTRVPPNDNQATVEFTTEEGTATEEVDYIPKSGMLTFAPGQTTQSITIQVFGDGIDEPDETFFVRLFNADGAGASQSPGTGTIQDDDAAPGIRISDATGDEGTELQFVVTLLNSGVPGPSGQTVTVAFTTLDATSGNIATSGIDYQPTSGMLTFAPGVSQLTIPVTALNDVEPEPLETFQVRLSNSTNASISNDTGFGNIVDVPPAIIKGFVYADMNNDGLRGIDAMGNLEVGIPNVMITATKVGGVPFTSDPVFTGPDGSYSIVGVPPGVYIVKETQPGFFVDGKDTYLGVESPVNDQHVGVVVEAMQTVSGYNFGERGWRPEFVPMLFDRRQLFASAVVGGQFGPATTATRLNPRLGDIWISFDGGWDGLRTIDAIFEASQGSATMYLYNNSLVQVAVSAPTPDGARLQYFGTSGSAYFLKLTGTNTEVTLHSDPPVLSSAGPLSALGGTSDSGSTNVVPANNVLPADPPTSTVTAAAPAFDVTTLFASSLATTVEPLTSDDATDAALEEDEDWFAEALAS